MQKCEAGHIAHRWHSQPKLKARGVHAGDFLVASSILLSGNNHAKIALLMNFANIENISSNFYLAVQGLYVIPEVEKTYKGMTTEVAQRLSSKKLILCGMLCTLYNVNNDV